jgi:hypothetical protein
VGRQLGDEAWRRVILKLNRWRTWRRVADVVVAEGEYRLIKDDVPGRDDVAGGDVVASVAAVITRVPDEDACGGRGASLCADVASMLG